MSKSSIHDPRGNRNRNFERRRALARRDEHRKAKQLKEPRQAMEQETIKEYRLLNVAITQQQINEIRDEKIEEGHRRIVDFTFTIDGRTYELSFEQLRELLGMHAQAIGAPIEPSDMDDFDCRR